MAYYKKLTDYKGGGSMIDNNLSHNVYYEKSDNPFSLQNNTRKNAWLHWIITTLAYLTAVNLTVLVVINSFRFFWGN